MRVWPTTLRAGILGLGLLACTNAAARVPERDAERRPVGHRAVDRTLVAGTLVEATMHGSLSEARVSADVRNARGWVVIPAGSAVAVTVGRRLTSMTVRGQVYPVNATIELPPAAGTRILFVLPEGFTAQPRLGEMP